MAEDDVYTKDGTVDWRGNPADKNETGTWRACPFILGNECCERLAYYGMSTNLVLYFKKRLHQHSATASKNVSNWSGTCYITPLIGAFLADSYLGRYWTIACFSIIYVIGMTLLTMSASVSGMKPTCHGHGDENCHPTTLQSAMCFLALYLIALGTGGIKPCVSSYGADQFDDADPVEKERKSFFFNWFYFSINIGALIASSLLVWIQDNVGWGWGFGIPAVAMAIAVVSFFSGTRLYRNQKPGGSSLTRICQVVVASTRKYHVEVPADKSLLHEVADTESAIKGSRKLDHTNELRFFDKAAVVGESDNVKDSVNPWRLCTVTQVEELKSILRLLPVWATGIIFATVYGQMSTLFVLQGQTMNTYVGNSNFQIPPASLSIFDTLSVIFWVPVYDRIIVPFARKFSRHKNGLTQLQRMGIGLFISIFSMVAAALLELIRLRMVRRHNYYKLDEIPMSIFWQVPQYFIIGCAEVFMFIGQLEFFYEQAPDAMRSFCSALQLITVALGQYLSSLLVTIVTKITTKNGSPGWIPDNLNYGHIDYFFWLLAGLSVLNLMAYIGVAMMYTYKRPVGTLR
ncbi:protein NRT1/ PTR FAMILY 8.1-like [Abrus precatorius]|uniref:Protein NRT1/ PTR FAMILY 8.1-like n=1 Tax=Abrus precatorius TaxID=3816 RepID=A0A8B8JSY2_ABRPR|nr:protein NRT1/ PTR FAMILY 8.1-like [Abrus precatorius]XP_027334610.1 protein NRT1/ PTR FAMILY 8.1-like [Abrus precatorius]XP_027334611.1 protein NRT1/ PTR FAMILY 8.1-like [Abrus precatorius]XP_027334612.1 protein NRT1/ PTR FAMILY 8.1-like [Abrus precatorius]XP_027334613.1 protein NRT1/ PTR FAMILY 8.1-like [Abrus precatorius]XP_027334614.1 protein NRT1/ PTR FAMILY 8.1-like [Abrus precatorius]